MELKDIKILGSIIPGVLKIVTKQDLPEKDFDFVYGQEEYTTDFKKLKKQFKRLWRKRK
jgi:hypothetical protein|tara:strand:- start:1599 stop:1775 length:177 start_codon:yes stop_codon:yes gene_type:complete